MCALPHLGLALAASGRYEEALRIFAEAKRIGREHEVWMLLARSLAMWGGCHLEVFDLAGAEVLAEEARELGRSVNFKLPVVSAGIDLVFNLVRRGDVARAEKLAAEVSEARTQAAPSHEWIWGLRFAQARAELALARGDGDEAVRLAADVIAQSGACQRVKYQVAGLGTRGKALAALGRCKAAVRDLRQAVALARPVGDPAMFLRAAATLLELEGDGDLAAEARIAAQRIAAALPDGPMRLRFEAAEPVRLLGSLR
jgi:tetratricopeptide (TPR) repeat protein